MVAWSVESGRAAATTVASELSALSERFELCEPSLLWLLSDPGEQVSHVAIAFDNPIESFRNDLFDGYKTGEGIEEALHAQFDLAEEAAAAAGVVVWRMDRWEADDALAALPVELREQDIHPLLQDRHPLVLASRRLARSRELGLQLGDARP